MWFLAVVAVIGIVVLIANTLLRGQRAAKDPHDQPDVVHGSPPPDDPGRPVPGSRADRARRGAP
ncbi:MAG: hypothetical protein HYX34_05535 [Actinobacteria bacterium]|nr:hypothetical protein [Actinomycetota bacterium]